MGRVCKLMVKAKKHKDGISAYVEPALLPLSAPESSVTKMCIRDRIRGGMGSVARLFVAQMQDYLELGAGCRMNKPSTLGGNWEWRLLSGELTGSLADRIYDAVRIYGRIDRKKDESKSE